MTDSHIPEPPNHSNSTPPQAFARAYRPQNFTEVVGQEHVLQALRYSLDHNNLHHAYLLTGTRGVGKTTLGRIFAKALNCEQGISATPCGHCSACTSIASGRFVDLIEVDGASNTKVEDTRELLEDVQFVPTQGRFKVYLIDEVHMLSTHSFNALLKTLEEPPEHVKFILATTDPQKLPVTVLSRCLQFHLQLLSVPLIAQHIEKILAQEHIDNEQQATYLLAQAAQGSMRDALTLTDQARSQGQGRITTASVTQMLGILDQQLSHRLLLASLEATPAQVLHVFEEVEKSGADPDQILKDLIELCHQVALVQALGAESASTLIIDPGTQESVLHLAEHSSPEQLQLNYETLLHARKTLSYSSSPAVAVRMALLRMTCFQSFAVDEVKTESSTDQLSSNSLHSNQQSQPQEEYSAPVQTAQPRDTPAAEEKKNLNLGQTSQDTIPSPPEPFVKVHPGKSTDQSASAVPLTKAVAIEALAEAQPWYIFVRDSGAGGLFGQLLLNSRLTELQQNNGKWKAHLVVSDTIFSYDAVETPKAVAQLLSTQLKQQFEVTSATASEIEDAPIRLKTAAQAAARAAYTQKVESTAFMTRLREIVPVMLTHQDLST